LGELDTGMINRTWVKTEKLHLKYIKQNAANFAQSRELKHKKLESCALLLQLAPVDDDVFRIGLICVVDNELSIGSSGLLPVPKTGMELTRGSCARVHDP